MDVIALIISILALVLSVVQFLRDVSRDKKEATLVAYDELQDDVFSILNQYSINLPEIEYLGEEWRTLTVCLAKIERFSVGINTGIYSLRILNRIGGAYYIRQFDKLKPIIDQKRKVNLSDGKHYDEFELTVTKLKLLRKLVK